MSEQKRSVAGALHDIFHPVTKPRELPGLWWRVTETGPYRAILFEDDGPGPKAMIELSAPTPDDMRSLLDFLGLEGDFSIEDVNIPHSPDAPMVEPGVTAWRTTRPTAFHYLVAEGSALAKFSAPTYPRLHEWVGLLLEVVVPPRESFRTLRQVRAAGGR